jgi:CHAT domain-containing protein
MVVLSACDTGLGEVHSGEGVFGLRRSFQLGGVKTIVMSLWEVPDRETIDLMSKFYEEIEKGNSKSESLHYATLRQMNARLGKNKAAHPFYWGAFVIFGEP